MGQDNTKTQKTVHRARSAVTSVIVLVTLSACAGASDTSTSSGLLSAQGSFIEPLVEATGASATIPGTANGYAFQVGLNDNRSEFATQAQLLNDTNLPSPTSGSTAFMTGAYQLKSLEHPTVGVDGLTGTRLNRSGEITLQVNFDDMSVSGSDKILSLDGKFDATGQLQGTASLGNMTGDLFGDVSDDQAVGVFDGKSASGVFAGGFIVDK